MDQYVRVSRVAGRSGESFISPDLQREQGAAWASSRGVEVTVVHEDLDQSGGKLERPGLDALMARIRAGRDGWRDRLETGPPEPLGRGRRAAPGRTDHGGGRLDRGARPRARPDNAVWRVRHDDHARAGTHGTPPHERGVGARQDAGARSRRSDGTNAVRLHARRRRLARPASEVGARRQASVQARRRPGRRRGARVSAQASTSVSLGWSAGRSSQAQRRSSDLERVHRAATVAQP